MGAFIVSIDLRGFRGEGAGIRRMNKAKNKLRKRVRRGDWDRTHKSCYHKSIGKSRGNWGGIQTGCRRAGGSRTETNDEEGFPPPWRGRNGGAFDGQWVLDSMKMIGVGKPADDGADEDQLHDQLGMLKSEINGELAAV